MVAGSDNLATAVNEWNAEFLPDNVLLEKLLEALALRIVRLMKMSWWGTGLRLVVVQYQDVVSDVLVMNLFYKEGQFGAFKATLSFFCLALQY